MLSFLFSVEIDFIFFFAQFFGRHDGFAHAKQYFHLLDVDYASAYFDVKENAMNEIMLKHFAVK